MRLIDADALTEQVKQEPTDGMYTHEVVALVEEQPTIEAVPMRPAQWIKLYAYAGMEQYKCSACRAECFVPTCMGEPMYDFCPNCGAKIDGGNDHATD